MGIKTKLYILCFLTRILFLSQAYAQQTDVKRTDSLKLLADSINQALAGVEDSLKFLELLNRQRTSF